MSDAAKQAILGSTEGNAHRCFSNAQAIVTAYAGSANANPERIPKLFAELVELFATGERPMPQTRVQG